MGEKEIDSLIFHSHIDESLSTEICIVLVSYILRI